MKLSCSRLAVRFCALALIVVGPALFARAENTNSESAYLSDMVAGRTVLRFKIEITREGIKKL